MGPSTAQGKALDRDLGHQLTEVNVYLKTGSAKAASPQSTLICCLRCGTYSQHRCQLLGHPCKGITVSGATNLRRIRSGLHPDYTDRCSVSAVSLPSRRKLRRPRSL